MMARRCRCALPGCPRGDELFLTVKAGKEHLRVQHGVRLPWPKYEDGLVIQDPPRQGRWKRGPTKGYAPTDEEYARLLDVAQDRLDDFLFRVLGEAGLRAKELLYLRPPWLRGGVLHVPYEDPETGFKAKTRNADRAIPLRRMSPEAWDVLEGWYTNPPRSGRWSAKTPLGISHVTLWDRVHRGGLGAGLPRRLFPHALRSYAATKWAYRLGGNPFLLMDLMGWSDLKVALRYVRSTGRRLEDAVMTWNGNNVVHDNNGGSVPSPGSFRLA